MDTQFIGEVPPAVIIPGTFTVATLPDALLNSRMYAWVSDLYGVGGYCVSEGGNWRPVRPLALQYQAATADIILTPMLSSPTQIITGTIGLGITRNVTMSLTNAYQGASFRVNRKATGTGVLNLVGVLSALPINNWGDFSFDGSAWVQTASGGLL